VTAGGGEVVKVSTSLAVRCAFLTYRLPTDWYFPVGDPHGLVWAQHGFVESRKVWTEFATRAARAGFLVVAPTLPTADLFGCTVQNLGNNPRFLNHVAEVFDPASADGRRTGHGGRPVGAGAISASYVEALRKSGQGTVVHGNVCQRKSGQDEAREDESREDESREDRSREPQAGREQLGGERVGQGKSGRWPSSPFEPALPDQVAFVGHSAGGEAALYLAGRLIEARDDRVASGRPDVAGVVLADPVTSVVDRTMAPSLAVLDRSNVPVLTVASPPNSCNARHRGVAVVVDGLTSRPFIGVQLATGSHADLLGASVGAVERRVCGTPEPKNIEAAQRLAIGWLGEMLGREAGSPDPPGCRPGGAAYEELLGAGVISPLR